MNINYQRPKGNRIKGSRFFGLKAETKDGCMYWYCNDDKRWYLYHNRPRDYSSLGNTNYNINSVKAAIRHINKCNLPKGTCFKLSSFYVGFDVYFVK